MTRPSALITLQRAMMDETSAARLLSELSVRADVLGWTDSPTDMATSLADTDVLVTGWGSPLVDRGVLEQAPRLRCVLHVAGSVRGVLDEDVWRRGIAVSSAVEANAVSVAEYTVAMVLAANKRVAQIAHRYREEQQFVDLAGLGRIGNYRRTIGIVGASRVGRRVAAMLAPFDFDVVLFDPTLDDDQVIALGATPVSLPDLCAMSDVVSVHAPSLPATNGLISRTLIDSMRPGATLINTARGEIVDQHALTDRILRGDLFAVLDVTVPWVLPPDHPLYTHPNVLLTPHIAGSVGTEVDRMIDSQMAELDRFIAGRPLAYPVVLESLRTAA